MPFAALAQKEIKPSIANAEKALRAGKIDEAKAIIDLFTSSQEYMVDKKGQPSKSAAKAWYLKGVIYAGIDTTKVEKFKSLAPNGGFSIAKEAFEKAEELDKGKNPAFLNDDVGFPMMNEQVKGYLAQSYLNSAVRAYQEEKNFKKALEYTEHTLYFMPNDTTTLLYAGAYFAPSVEEYDKSITYLNSYIANGGKSKDAYNALIDVFYNKKKEYEKAIEITKKAQIAYPDDTGYKQNEMSIYVGQKKYDIARQMVETWVKEDPTSKDNFFLLGQLNQELGEPDKAKEAYSNALKIDSKYFEAATNLADLYWKDAKAVKDQMNQLGNSKADMAKLQELDKAYVKKLEIALPYIESCEKISPDDVGVLYSLLTVYSDLDYQDKITKVKKRLKTLGEDVD